MRVLKFSQPKGIFNEVLRIPTTEGFFDIYLSQWGMYHMQQNMVPLKTFYSASLSHSSFYIAGVTNKSSLHVFALWKEDRAPMCVPVLKLLLYDLFENLRDVEKPLNLCFLHYHILIFCLDPSLLIQMHTILLWEAVAQKGLIYM